MPEPEDTWIKNAAKQEAAFTAQETDFLAEAKRRAAEDRVRQKTCDHAGYTFEKMGRCCFACGAFMADWGD